ncbi:hypothetical protein AEA42_11505 [Shewanella sp. Sh95]|uniref:hypothetical protein n=1 Tax=Shewanella sp. Sh95 TaxID=1689868 RepID=UPI0006DAA8A7|nr:hypothetical protein [Shewanella sp. Sh95]KPN76859.1 hypothetical protein AEA42_11505 [Shewanella sp. Sh95]
MIHTALSVSTENAYSRVKLLQANVLGLCTSSCALTHVDGRVFGEYLYESVDAVLIDAPCGGGMAFP